MFLDGIVFTGLDVKPAEVSFAAKAARSWGSEFSWSINNLPFDSSICLYFPSILTEILELLLDCE